MPSEYPIMYDNKTVGEASVSRQGMYCIVACHVHDKIPYPFRILFMNSEQQVDLGICVRAGAGYRLVSRLPAKMIMRNTIHFQIHYSQKASTAAFYAILEDAPFQHLSELKNARFSVQDGKTGIVFQKFTE